jgi:hypothetical protein
VVDEVETADESEGSEQPSDAEGATPGTPASSERDQEAEK